MSLDDFTPTEYFGPHAKRWTNPETGATLSLSPRDYDRAVLREKARALEPEYHDVEGDMNERVPADRTLAEAQFAAWDGAAPMAGMFKEEGVLIAPLSSWNPPEHQRYDLNAFATDEERGKPLQPSEGLPTFATRGGIKYPEMIDRNQAETKQILAKVNDDLSTITGAKISSTHLEISADGIKPLTAAGMRMVDGPGMDGARIRYLSLSEDDSLGIIRPVEQKAPGKPAARHFRRRKIGRNTLRLGLLYIIAVIGVISVAVEVL